MLAAVTSQAVADWLLAVTVKVTVSPLRMEVLSFKRPTSSWFPVHPAGSWCAHAACPPTRVTSPTNRPASSRIDRLGSLVAPFDLQLGSPLTIYHPRLYVDIDRLIDRLRHPNTRPTVSLPSFLADDAAEHRPSPTRLSRSLAGERLRSALIEFSTVAAIHLRWWRMRPDIDSRDAIDS